MPILVGIVEDQTATLMGVLSILRRHNDIAVVASGSRAAAVAAAGRMVDVALLDLPLSDGTAAGDNVRALLKVSARVVVFASGAFPELIQEAARAGAWGLIHKTSMPDTIVGAVRRAASGHPFERPGWGAARAESPARLTDREIEVLSLYVSGGTADDVARTLSISRDTVLDHIRRTRAKYAGVNRPAPTKVDLFKRAIEDGLVSSHTAPSESMGRELLQRTCSAF